MNRDIVMVDLKKRIRGLPETYDIRIDGDTLMMALPSSPDAVFGYTRQG